MMKLIKSGIIYLLMSGYLMAIGGVGLLGNMGSPMEPYTENEGDLNLSSSSNGSPIGGGIFIYFDALPADLSLEYSFEMGSEPIAVSLKYLEQEYNEDLFSLKQSHYLTIKKDIFELSIPLLAKASLYTGAGCNQHNTIAPSINLITQLMDDVETNQLIGAIESNSLEYTSSDILDYAKKENGVHLQIGLRAKVLTFNMFINARHTFGEIQQSKGFTDLSVRFAFGI